MGAVKTRTEILDPEIIRGIHDRFPRLNDARLKMRINIPTARFYEIMRGEDCTEGELASIKMAWLVMTRRIGDDATASAALDAAVAVYNSRGVRAHRNDILRDMVRAMKIEV